MEEIQRQDFLNFYDDSQISLGNQASLVFCSAFLVYYFFLQVVTMATSAPDIISMFYIAGRKKE